MASQSTIAVQIRTALAQYLKRDADSIRPSDRLREDLGLDSLAMIELLFRIEEHFDLEIPNEDLSRVTTVADVTAYVEDKLAGLPTRPHAAPPAAASRPVPDPAIGAKPVPARALSAKPAPPPALAAKPTPATPSRSAKAPAPAKRAPAKVTSIKAAAKRRSTRPAAKGASASAKGAPAKKKGSRRA